jgi:hypothetical protein
MKRNFVLLLSCFTLLSSCIKEDDVITTATGNIEGTVVDVMTDKPMSGIDITIVMSKDSFEWATERRLTTDNDGRFMANDLPAGMWYISISSPPPYADFTSFVDVSAEQTTSCDITLTITDMEIKDGILLYYRGYEMWGDAQVWKPTRVLTLPEGIVGIKSDAFKDAGPLLNSVILPSTLVTIGDAAFKLSLIRSLDIPFGVISIGEYAFWFSNIFSVVIPGSVRSIGRHAFEGIDHSNSTWDGITSLDVTVSWTTPLKITDDVFSSAGTLHVPAGTKSLYEQATGWKKFGTIVEY